MCVSPCVSLHPPPPSLSLSLCASVPVCLSDLFVSKKKRQNAILLAHKVRFGSVELTIKEEEEGSMCQLRRRVSEEKTYRSVSGKLVKIMT